MSRSTRDDEAVEVLVRLGVEHTRPVDLQLVCVHGSSRHDQLAGRGDLRDQRDLDVVGSLVVARNHHADWASVVRVDRDRGCFAGIRHTVDFQVDDFIAEDLNEVALTALVTRSSEDEVVFVASELDAAVASDTEVERTGEASAIPVVVISLLGRRGRVGAAARRIRRSGAGGIALAAVTAKVAEARHQEEDEQKNAVGQRNSKWDEVKDASSNYLEKQERA